MYEGSDGQRYEVLEIQTGREYYNKLEGQWHRAQGKPTRDFKTRCGKELNPPREDDTFVTVPGGVVLSSIKS